jgi:hypothetical protein
MKYKLTNRLNLPGPIVEAVKNDPYTAGDSDYTATSLLQPPRIAALRSKYGVTEDAADRIYTLQGQIMHGILERAGKELAQQGYIVERRFKGTFRIGSRIFKVSAQIDLFDPASATLSDYKYTGVYAANNGLKEEHRLQLNLQAELLRREGFQVEKAEVILFFRDWHASRASEDRSYPQSPVMKQEVPLMTAEEVKGWVIGRIVAHESAKQELPLCTDEERWATKSKWAVMKEGRKSALRVFDTKEEAINFMTQDDFYRAPNAPIISLVERPGRSIRCLHWCPVRSTCEQGKQYRPKLEVDEDGFVKVS